MQELKSIGLTDAETRVYISLLKKGEAIAADIAADANIARTYVYDAIKSLQKKGLVSFVIKNNKKFFIAAPPEKIIDYLKEKQQKVLQEEGMIKSVIPQLNAILKTSKEKPKISVYEGKEGLKTVLNDIIKTKKDGCVWGGSKMVEKLIPDYTKKYLREKTKYKIRMKQLFSEPAGYIKHKYTTVKKAAKKLFQPLNDCNLRK